MLNSIIRISLAQRWLVLALALFVVGFGTWQTTRLPIDVFPDLNRPRVVVMTEAHGMAPEEVETLITFPLETALNGATGVEAVRSSSGVGISVVYVEFAWGTDIYLDRQIVAERLQMAQERLPPGIQPQLAPVSSIMGQIVMVGLWSEADSPVDPMRLRTIADWDVRQRLLSVPGVSQVFTMGGERKQFQVLVEPEDLLRYGVTLDDVKQAVLASNENATGGYLEQQGPEELLVRGIGRVQSVDDLKSVVVAVRDGRSVALSQVATVTEGAQVKRGDSAAFVRESAGGNTEEPAGPAAEWSGGPAVVLTINKQPGADTRSVTEDVAATLEQLESGLPGVRMEVMYSQRSFIDRAIENVIEALRDGGLLVVVILFLFLMNLRTTLITLTAIPLSILMTAIVFTYFELAINAMTLGGLAVAIGELVDDAIVDVENIFRRLKQNRLLDEPRHPLTVVYLASAEIRNSIVFGTMIVILAFLPLFALSGMEGRLFAPLGVAYIVSIFSSLIVSLTVTPVLSYWLLGRNTGRISEADGPLLRLLKRLAGVSIGISLRWPLLNLTVTSLLVVAAMAALMRLDRDFLPPFNEGAVQLNVLLPPGSSLATSNEINQAVEAELREIPDIARFVRRTGRAELDEHAEGVNHSEYIIELDPHSPRSREEQLEEIRAAMEHVPGIVTAVEQPIAHLISHMLSGVKAQVGIKLFGDDLETLRRAAESIRAEIADVPGVTDLLVEPQTLIPQLRVEWDREQLLRYGLTIADVNELLSTAMSGERISEALIEQRTVDVIVRLADAAREDLEALRRLSLELEDGSRIPLSAVARIYESVGPNTINREHVRRRIVVQCNVRDRGVVDVVNELRQRVDRVVDELPPGYYVTYEGQFESQQSASRTITLLFVVSLLGIFLVLFAMFGSANLSLQVLAAIPTAFIGSVAALLLTGQTLTIAAMVGFISLAGIASRNGILLLNHYLHLVRYEGADFSHAMIVRAGQERLAPVLMTALTSGIGLVPLVIAAGEPGKEILYPVATVILGGLISSTLAEFLVRPALFWRFGTHSAARLVSHRSASGPLDADALQR